MRNLANYKYNGTVSRPERERNTGVGSDPVPDTRVQRELPPGKFGKVQPPRPARMRTWPGAARRDARARGGGCGRGGAPPCATRQVSPNHARDKSNSKTRPTTAKAQDARGQDPPETVIYGLCGLSADCAARTDLGARTRLVTPVVSTAHTHAMTYVRCANAARAPRERHAQSSRTESAATLQPLYMYDHRLARLLL